MTVRRRLIATAAFMGLLFFLSAIPGSSRVDDSSFVWIVELTPRLWQKALHVILYGALACCWAWSLEAMAQPKRGLTALAVTVMFGAAMEAYQLRVPGRFGTLTDVLLNAFGAVLGLAVAYLGATLVWRRRAR